MFKLKEWKRALESLGQPMRPRAERRPAPGLEAHYGPNTALTPAGIKDISSTGIYLMTQKRLSTGEVVTLKLSEHGNPENNIELRVLVEAKVARHGEDGTGLSFVLPPGLDSDLWGVLIRNIVVLTNRDQIAHMFRTLRTIVLLCRLCHSGAEEAILLLGGQLNDQRTETMIKIALAAEDRLALDPDAGRMRAHPKLLASILREASWATDELRLQLWTGLLVSSCSAHPPDDSNQILADLLIHLAPIQAKIFCHACERALAALAETAGSSSASVVLSPEQMIELTCVSDLNRNATDVAYLFNLGLIQKLFDFTSYRETENFDVTPSELGITLYRHCQGERAKIDQRLVDSANAHLLNFIPPPVSSVFDDRTPPAPHYSPGD